MDDQALVTRARRVWEELAGVPVRFPAKGVTVVESPRSRLCPPGWAGIVAIGDAAIATVPAGRLTLPELPVAQLTDPDVLRSLLPIAETLGPATLAYRNDAPLAAEGVETGDIGELVQAASADEAGEAALDEITSPAFLVRENGRPVAAAGYQVWPGGAAHLSVLTAADQRGRGHARRAAAAAVAHALTAGLLPQWRARPEPSRRVARALGFAELGAQLSFRQDPNHSGSAVGDRVGG